MAATTRTWFVIEDGFGSDTLYGGEGGTDTDTLDLSALTTGVNLDITGTERGEFTDGTDTATFREVEDFVLTSQNDTVDARNLGSGIEISTGAGDDRVIGTNAADTVYGEAGNDALFGGFGGAGSVMYGGIGDDLFYAGSSVNDTQYGGSGDDAMAGGVGNDVFYGGADNDTLRGFGGFDSIDGGDDLLYGGDGADIFDVEDTFGTDTLYGGEGGVDIDTLDLSRQGEGVTVTFTGDEQGTFTDGTDTATFFGIENAVLTDQDDVFDASDHTQNIGVEVDGGGGDDTLIGGDTGVPADTFYGGTGNDSPGWRHRCRHIVRRRRRRSARWWREHRYPLWRRGR